MNGTVFSMKYPLSLPWLSLITWMSSQSHTVANVFLDMLIKKKDFLRTTGLTSKFDTHLGMWKYPTFGLSIPS